MTNRLGVGIVLAAVFALGGAHAQEKAAPQAKPAGKAKAEPKAGAAKEQPSNGAAAKPQPMAGVVPVKPRPPRKPPLVQNWDQIDPDKDGKASLDDVHKILKEFPEKRFRELDVNHDNVLQLDELPEVGKPQRRNPDMPPVNQGQGPLFELMQTSDKDKDSKITEAEFKEAHPNGPADEFKHLDANSDGVISNLDYPSPDPHAGIKGADTNGDGKVTREECKARFPKWPDAYFDQMDKNGDGVIDENDQLGKAMPRPAGAKRAPANWSTIVARLLAKYDKGRDSKLTFEEYSGSNVPKEQFDQMDTNHDGVVSLDDPAPVDKPDLMKKLQEDAPPSSAERFKRADKDGDGKLSYDEASAEFKNLTRPRFDERDLNHDGFLGPEDKALHETGAKPADAAAPKAEPAAKTEEPKAKPAEATPEKK